MTPADLTFFTRGWLCERLLEHFHNFGSITQKDADALYGITRLGARVYNLKQMGYKISKVIVKSTNRYGDKVHYARYFMDKTNGGKTEC